MQKESETETPLSNEPSKRVTLNARGARALVAATVLTVAICAVAPFYLSRSASTPDGKRVGQLVTTHDLWMHLHTMAQFDKVLRSGVFYPRWVPDINHGYGILTLIYYPPGFFYLSSAVNAVFHDWLNTLFVLSALGLAGSGFALYFLARTFYGRLASAVAAVFYLVLPIHMLDLYWRGGLPQFIGYIFPPLIIYFADKLGREGKLRHYAGFASVYGAHILTHLPVSLMFTYGLAFYAVVWAVKERDWRIGARLAAAMALGLLLSAIYWLPAALETRYAYEFATEIFPYHQSYITLLPVSDGGLYPDFFRVLNPVFALSVLALAVTMLISRITRGPHPSVAAESRQWTPLSMWIVMSISTTFMCTSFSIYISTLLPKIQVAVPAWRWLSLAGMFTALAVAAAIDALSKRPELAPRLVWVCRAAMVAVIAVNVVFAIKWTIIKPLSNPTYYPVAPVSNVVESSWTPRNSTHPQGLADTPLVLVEPEGGAVEISRWDPQDREVRVRVDKPSMVRLKTYNFPGWTAQIDDKLAPMLSDKDGVQQVEVSPGAHVIKASFKNTPVRTAGTLLSAIALLAVIGLAVLGRTKEAGDAEVAAATGAMPRRRYLRWVSGGVFGPAVLGLIVVAVIFIWVNSRSRPGGAAPGGGGTPSKAQNSVTPGGEATLHLEGTTSILVALDEQALNDVINARAAKDSSRIDALVQEGKVVSVANDTGVRVLELSGGKARVRLLQGEHQMTEGFVPERWIR
jgi:hypothetical protein